MSWKKLLLGAGLVALMGTGCATQMSTGQITAIGFTGRTRRRN